MVEVRGRATAEVMVLAILVFIAQMVLSAIGLGLELFALAAPLTERPWTLVTSVYAHGSIDHLLANLVGLVIFGLIVERRSTRLRFHSFVLFTGALAALTEVLIGSLLGATPYVIGISGAVFALMGYALSSNPVTETVVGWFELNTRTQLVVMVALAVVLTVVTWDRQVAMFGHFAGFLLGLIAGRMHVLRA